MTGGVVSTTVILNVQVAVSPLQSVAVAVTTVTPTGKQKPEAGTLTMEGANEQHTSLAVTVKFTVAQSFPSHSTV